MVRRRLLLQLLAGSLGTLGGCTRPSSDAGDGDGGDDADGDGGESGSPESDAGDGSTAPGDELPTEVPDDAPPGVGDDGSVDGATLGEAARTALSEASWKAVATSGGRTETAWVDGTDEFVDSGDRTWRQELLSITAREGDEARYDVEFVRPPRGAIVGVREYVPGAVATAVETRTWRYAETRGTGERRRHVLFGAGAPDDDGIVDPLYGELVVDGDGRVHSLTGAEVDGSADVSRFDFEFEYGIDAVPRPDWVDDVPHLAAAVVRDETLFELRNEGGTDVPGGTTLTFWQGDSYERELRTPLEPGDSLSVGLRGEEPERTAVWSRSEPDATVSLSDSWPRIRGEFERPDGAVVAVDIGVSTHPRSFR